MIKITPLSYALISSRTFFKGNKKVTYSTLWEKGHALFSELPDFIDNYDHKSGVILEEQSFFLGGEYLNGEDSFFYADDLTSEDLQEVEKIYNNMKGNECPLKTEWTWDDLTITMFGEFEVEDEKNHKYRVIDNSPDLPV